MAKIAVAVERAVARRARDGAPGSTSPRPLARGEGWSVSDVLCTYGPHDRPLPEEHALVNIAVVAAGTFQYRSRSGSAFMTPGSILLGVPGQGFACGHEHGSGDRCVLFQFDPQVFEEFAGVRFEALRLPPLRSLAGVTARACAGVTTRECDRGYREDARTAEPWEELALLLAARVLEATPGEGPATLEPLPSDAARVTRVVRRIETSLEGDLSLGALAAEARLSRFHFLRTFERLTGLTPHQCVRRARLREAATRLATEATPLPEVAYDSGFGDLATFHHAFRSEFGMPPRRYRLADAARSAGAGR
ncbi:MAG TPA: AraC family transcriptional regulator [Candidatus Polarisedimenticolia bacterium]|nr:AraC family transcriptional regulator [Candidatus Polarisedimenticolia bacterium]